MNRAPGAERPPLGRTWGRSTWGGSTLGRIDRYPTMHTPSVVVLGESPCPRGSSRTNFQVLVLVLVLELQVLVLVLVLGHEVLVLVLVLEA